MFVKICGITNEDDALLAVAMGADAVGFVFAPSSRQVAASQVYDITRRLPPEILTVGVFRDELLGMLDRVRVGEGFEPADQLRVLPSGEDGRDVGVRWRAQDQPPVAQNRRWVRGGFRSGFE